MAVVGPTSALQIKLMQGVRLVVSLWNLGVVTSNAQAAMKDLCILVARRDSLCGNPAIGP